MNFVQDEFDSLRVDAEAYRENYETGTSLLPRKVILLHTLRYLIHVKDTMKRHEEQNLGSITTNQLKQIKFEDSTAYLCQEMSKNYQQILMEKESRGETKLCSKDIFKLLWATLKCELITLCILFSLEGVSRLCFSYLVFFLFEAVHLERYSEAYIYCSILTVLWYASQILEHLGLNGAFFVGPKIKAVLSMFMFSKISTLTSFALRSSYLGTITNLVTNDLSALDERIVLIFNNFPFIVGVIGITLILIKQIGIVGVVGVLIILLVVPITHFISKANGGLIKQLTSLKDQRIQITTEVI